jgi:hypothetical protein
MKIKEALEKLYNLAVNNKTDEYENSYEQAFDIITDELEFKDKVIENMCWYIARNWNTTRFCTKENLDDCKCTKYLETECVKNYFFKKLNKGG